MNRDDAARLRNWDSEQGALGTACDWSEWALRGESAAVRQIRSQIQRIAPYFRTGLIRGEAGSGKQAVARAIHALSPGCKGRLVVIGAAALMDATATLRCGTIYLERVDEVPLCQQAALLQFVRDCEKHRVATGAETRILASSERDLRTLAAIGQFSQDLYMRLSAVELQVPPLRHRLDDIPILAELLLRRLADEMEQPGKLLADSTLVQLRERQWPENLRELERVVAQAAALAESGTIEPWHLQILARGDSAQPVAEPPLRLERLQDVVRRHVLDVLTRCGGNKLRAAELLGISRSTLYRMLSAKPGSMRSLAE